MDLVKVLENIDKISKDGIPFNVAVEPQTLKSAGMYIVVGLLLCGLVTGLLVSGAILISKK